MSDTITGQFGSNLKTLSDTLTAESLESFYNSVDKLKDESAAISECIKEKFNAFASSTRADTAALKMGYKLHALIKKDPAKAKALDFEYSKLTMMLIPDSAGWKQEPLL